MDKDNIVVNVSFLSYKTLLSNTANNGEFPAPSGNVNLILQTSRRMSRASKQTVAVVYYEDSRI